jgi:hypothetical protein
VKRFRYGLDPLALAAGTAYAANRWLVPAAAKGPFLRWHFADLLLIPAALPLMLGVYRRLGLRDHDRQPDWREVVLHLVVWSAAAEVIGPRLFSRATGDLLDVAAYAAGAAVALPWWTLTVAVAPSRGSPGSPDFQ